MHENKRSDESSSHRTFYCGQPTISGTPLQGDTLTALASGFTDADGLGTIAYQGGGTVP